MRRLLLTAAILCAGTATGGQAQNVQRMADSVLALNRTGHWSEAERIATATLQANPTAREMVARCQLVASLAWAQLRQRKPAGAASTIKVYDGACRNETSLTGFTSEVAAMTREIAAAASTKQLQ